MPAVYDIPDYDILLRQPDIQHQSYSMFTEQALESCLACRQCSVNVSFQDVGWGEKASSRSPKL